MESAVQKINTSDAGLGRKMRIYGICYLILQIVLFFAVLFSTIGFTSSIFTISEEDQISSLMIEYFRSVATWTIVITSLFIIIAIWYTLGFRALSKITHWRPNLLYKVFGILIIGYICEFGIGIYSVSHLFSLANILSSTIIDWSDTAVFESYLAQINGSLILVDVISLLSQGLIFIGYMTLKKWGEGLVEYIPAYSPKYNIERAFNFIVIGSGLDIIGGLISLIPDSDIGGWISLVGMIFMLIGFMRGGNLLKGGIPTMPAVRPTAYSSYQQYPPSNMPPSYVTQTSQPPHPIQPSFNQPTMNALETQNPTTQYRICPVCGQADIPLDAKFCHACGRII